MQETQRRNKIYDWMQRHYFWTAFFLNAILAIIVFFPLCMKYTGVLTFAEDFAGETIPYRYFVRNALRTGDIFWNWNIDLGSDFMQSFGACWFINPFRLIPTLLPEKYLLTCSVVLMVIRYALAGAGTTLYLRRYTQSLSTALIGGVLYAFSGFQATLLIFDMLGDVSVFFPFYMNALEGLVEENKKGRFAFWVFMLCGCSFVLFVGVFFFTVIFFFVKYFEKTKQFFIKMLYCLREGIIGGCLAGINLIPNLYALMNDTRASSKLLGANALTFDSTRIMLILRGWLFPAEAMSKSSHIVTAEWCTMGMYLPLIGCLLFLAYIYHKKNDTWLKKLLIFFIIACFVPFLNNAFMMESSSPYSRWCFMLLLLEIAACCEVIDHHKEYNLFKINLALLGMMTGYLYIVYFVPWYTPDTTIELIRPTRLLIGAVMGAFGICLTTFIFKIRKPKIMKSLLFVGIILYAISTNIIMGHDYQLPSGNTASDYGNDAVSIQNEVIESGRPFKDLDIEVLPYRTRFWRDYFNLGMIYGIPNRTSFVSVVDTSINTFYSNMGTPRDFAISPGGNPGTDELLSVKYYVTDKPDTRWKLITSYNNGNRDLYLYEDEEALPIAYTYDSYINESEFLKLKNSIRTTAAMSALVIPDDEENIVSGTIAHTEERFAGNYNAEDYLGRRALHLKETAQNFSKTRKTFSFDITADQDKYVLVTVPYSEYWSVKVNGVDKDIISSNGLMAVPVEKGVNQLTFTYRPLITYLGFGLSGFGVIIFVIYLVLIKKGSKE